MSTNTQETKSIEDILKMIDSGKLLLPEFQRNFMWPLEKTETLFDSIFQDLFIGSLIIAKPKFDLACKKFDLRERGSRKWRPLPELKTSAFFEVNDVSYGKLSFSLFTKTLYKYFFPGANLFNIT